MTTRHTTRMPLNKLRMAIYSVSLGLLVTSHTALANPDMKDRTAQHLSGLSNDSQTKALGLGDFNQDGFEDLFVVRRGLNPVLLMNRDGVLTNETSSLLPNQSSGRNANYVEVFDANGNGLQDVIIANLSGFPVLYKNLGFDGQGNWLGFDNGTRIQSSYSSNNMVINSGDVNGDGAPDLLVAQATNRTRGSRGFTNSRLLINDGNGNFFDGSAGLVSPRNEGLLLHEALLKDVDGDGDIDIIAVHSDLILYVFYNDGSGRFDRRSALRNPDNFAYTFGAADFNGDGIFDYRVYSNPAPTAFMSTGNFDRNGIPTYQRRTDAPMLRGNRKHGFTDMRDVDGDGDMDYVLSSMLRNFAGLVNSSEGMRTEMVINQGVNSGRFTTFVGQDWGRSDSHDMVLMDVNNDGNMDMVVAHTTRYGVYINSAPPLKVELAANDEAKPSVSGSTATLVVEGVDSGEFTWDFGNGETTTTSEPSVEHQFDEPGRYNVTVTVTTPRGEDEVTFTHFVHLPLTENTPSVSMDVLYEARDDGDRVWSVNPDNNTVSAFDAFTGEKLAEINVGVEPRSLAMDSPGVLCVVNKASATISRVSTTNFSVLGIFPLPYGSMPHGLVFNQDKSSAYVTLEATGQVAKLNLRAREIDSLTEVGGSPRHLSLSADDSTLYVSRFITAPQEGEHTPDVETGGAGEVWVIDADTMEQQDTIALAYNDDPDTPDSARGIPNYVRAPALSPDGQSAIVPFKADNIFRGTMRDGNPREHDRILRSKLGFLNLNDNEENLARRFDFDNNSPVSAVAYSPTGNLVYIVHEASRSFEVMDAYSQEVLFSAEVGFAPQGVVVSPDGNRVYVHNYTSRSITAFDASEVNIGISDEVEKLGDWETVEDEVLSAEALRGSQFFHDSSDPRLVTQKYFACASCHSEGGHDGRVWDFADAGEGLRNTIDLRGRRGTGHGNVHWSANFDEIHDFENDIRGPFKGLGLMDNDDFADHEHPLQDSQKEGASADLDALSMFFEEKFTRFGNSPYRTSEGELTAEAEEGKTIFANENCGQCHSGVEFTDSPDEQFHDIGTINEFTGGRLGDPLPGGLDTPTLRGLWHGAPYLHNGSAANLTEAIKAHSAVSINDEDISKLEAYLLQIDDSEERAPFLDADGDGLGDKDDPAPNDPNINTPIIPEPPLPEPEPPVDPEEPVDPQPEEPVDPDPEEPVDPEPEDPKEEGEWWKPALGLRWQYQLDGDINTQIPADVYTIDLSYGKATVEQIKAQDKFAVCSFSAGTNESFRFDSASIPEALQAERYDEYSDESVLNIRDLVGLAPIMQARLDDCKDKGFDGILLEKVSLFDHATAVAEGTSFEIQEADNVRYIQWFAAEAHKRGLALGLKDGVALMDQVLSDIDFMVADSCFASDWCADAALVTDAKKPVFMVEFAENQVDYEAMCQTANTYQFSGILRDYKVNGNIDAYQACDIEDKAEWWKPDVGTTWQYQLDGEINTDYNVDAFDIDLSYGAETVAEINAKGKKAVCYFSVSTAESFRPDASQFPEAVLGEQYSEFSDERVLDIRNIEALAPFMRARLDDCLAKGFDGVDFDKIDIFIHETEVDGQTFKGTSFEFTAQDSIKYLEWLANEAHQRGLAVGLKNGVDIITDVVKDIDFMVADSCFTYGWCEAASPVINARKPVFMVEYTYNEVDFDAMCSKANELGFKAILRDGGLKDETFNACF